MEETKSRGLEKSAIQLETRSESLVAENMELRSTAATECAKADVASTSLLDLQASQLLLRMENQRLHAILCKALNDNDQLKKTTENFSSSSRS